MRDDDRAPVVAGADLLHGHDRRAQALGDRRPLERLHALVDDRRDRLHLGQHLESRLGLHRLRRLGAKAVDEGLQMGAPLLLLLGRLAREDLLLAALALEARIAAAPQGQLAAVEVQDLLRRRRRADRGHG